MTLEELAEHLGGKGKAKIVWDCYSIGVDPSHLFGKVIRLGWDDYESIVNRLPAKRRTQRLGPETLEKLEQLYKQSYSSSSSSSHPTTRSQKLKVVLQHCHTFHGQVMILPSYY